MTCILRVPSSGGGKLLPQNVQLPPQNLPRPMDITGAKKTLGYSLPAKWAKCSMTEIIDRNTILDLSITELTFN